MKLSNGDKIICINTDKQKRLILNQEYIVDKLDGHKIYVKGYARYSFLATRFKKV